jgi:hypothetical protein
MMYSTANWNVGEQLDNQSWCYMLFWQ